MLIFLISNRYRKGFIFIFFQAIFFILNILPLSGLYPQYASYDTVPSHAIGAGLASTGVGFRDGTLNLNSNPSLLAGSTSTIMDAGGLLSYQGSRPGTVKPSGIGIYVPLNTVSGWGLCGRLEYHSIYPAERRFSFFSGHLFYSRVFSEKFFLSIGIGPGFGIREREQSNLGVSPFLAWGMEWGKFLLGGKIVSPGGVYRYKLYRGGDELEERLPPIFSSGMTYRFTENLAIYGEMKRVLYEKSVFDLNGENSKPNFDRGVGAELKGSIGISFSLKEESIFNLRSGLEMGGKYDERGKNLRGTGIGFGLGYIPNPNGKGFELNISILDYSALSPKNGYPSETLFFMNLGYRYE